MLNLKVLKVVGTKCTKCNRPLRDPESMARGMGKTCAGIKKRKGSGRKSDCKTLDLFEENNAD